MAGTILIREAGGGGEEIWPECLVYHTIRISQKLGQNQILDGHKHWLEIGN